MDEVFGYLTNVRNWTAVGFLIQALIVAIAAVGFYIALPERITDRISRKNFFGVLLAVGAGIVFVMFVLPPISRLGWEFVAAVVIFILLAASVVLIRKL